MADADPEHLRVLVADERRTHLEPVGEALREMGHDVIALEVEVAAVARATHEHQPDLAIVVLHASGDHALELISELVHEASCPVCLLAAEPGRDFLARAARAGVFAHLDSTDETELAGGIEIAVQRYHQFRELLGAFERRARIERAKGLLMERHAIADQAAFDRLRDEARSSRRPLMAVVDELLASSAR
jgi:response regulator NasT